MAATESTMLELGTVAPSFSLPSASGETVSLDDVYAAYPRGCVIAFICNHCPFVIHVRTGLAAMARECAESGVGFVGINSNDASTHPDDAPDKMLDEIERAGYAFPYLVDASQEVAKAYRAACTPDFYLFDDERRLVYRGQFDASRPRNDHPVSGDDLRAAVQGMLAGEPPRTVQLPSIGCNIKWKAGSAPPYFG